MAYSQLFEQVIFQDLVEAFFGPVLVDGNSQIQNSLKLNLLELKTFRIILRIYCERVQIRCLDAEMAGKVLSFLPQRPYHKISQFAWQSARPGLF